MRLVETVCLKKRYFYAEKGNRTIPQNNNYIVSTVENSITNYIGENMKVDVIYLIRE